MSEMFSNIDDCYLLAKKLIKDLGDKIDFYGSIRTDTLSGGYLSSYRKNNREYMVNGYCIPFYFKFANQKFLRISIGSNYLKESSLGERVAALSEFYKILHEEYGEPNVFYTTKNGEEELLNLQWTFINNKEELEKFKIDDSGIDKLIVIGKNNKEGRGLKNETKINIARSIGLPFELLCLVEADLDNFIMYRRTDMIQSYYSKENCRHESSFEKKLQKRLYK